MYLIVGILILVSLGFYFTDKVKEAFQNIRYSREGGEKITNETKTTIVYLFGIPLLILWIAFLVTR